MTPISAPSIHYVVVLPEFILAGCALALLIATSLVRGRLSRAVGTAVVVVACAAVLADCVVQWLDVSRHGASTTVANAIIEDGFAIVAVGVIAISLGLSILVCHDWLARERVDGVELHILALASATGAVLMAQANDLVVIFLGLEILSIGLYVLAAFDRRSARSGEAGAQVLPPRRVLVGDLRLRHRPHLRRHGHDPAQPDRVVPLARTCSSPRASCSPGTDPRARRASRSRSPPSRSTSGRPTSTRARRPRSRATWPRSSRWARSPRCSASSPRRSSPSRRRGGRWSGRSPRSRCSSARRSPRSSAT